MAVAFNAPIGGLLFAFEEVASFFNTSLGWLIFFGEQHAQSEGAVGADMPLAGHPPKSATVVT